MKSFPYVRWTQAATDDLALRYFLLTIPSLTLHQRKVVLTCARVQSIPVPGSLLSSHFGNAWAVWITPTRTPGITTLYALVHSISSYLQSPILSGFISMVVRNAPWDDYSDIEVGLKEGISKELEAAQTLYHPECLNWESVFSIDPTYRRSHSIHRDIVADADLNNEIFARVSSALYDVSRRLHYPDYSKKTMGDIACENIAAGRYLQGTEAFEDRNSTYGLERIYHERGLLVEGPTEVRWAWKYNDLKPRIYYARGPDQYYSSRYIQSIFNILVDSLPNCHRFQRFFTNSIRGKPNDIAVLYDYSSFTSKFFESRCFILSLARLAKNYSVTVVDTYRGLVTLNLGDVLEHYYENCCNYPSFDVTKILGITSTPHEASMLIHNCTMLGVPGSISSCTFAHAIYLALVCGSLNSNRVVGDDAGMMIERMSRQRLKELVSPLGIVAEEKFIVWDEEDEVKELEDVQRWHYTKRPVEFFAGNFFVGSQANWPSAAAIFGWTDLHHTSLPQRDQYTELKKIVSMMMSFVLQFPKFPEMSELELKVVNRFLKIVNSHAVEGSPAYDRLRFGMVYPHSISGSGVMGDIVEQNWNQVVRIPDFMGFESIPDDLQRNEIMVAKMRKSISVARDLGYATVVPLYREILVRDNVEEFEKWVSRDFKPLYEIALHDDIPKWLWSLIISQIVHVNSPTSLNSPTESEEDYDSELST